MLGKNSSNSKADIFEAAVAAALDDADSSTTGSMIEDDESFCGFSRRFNQGSSRSESLRRHLSHQKKPSFHILEAQLQQKTKEGLHESTGEDEAIASSDEEDEDDAIEEEYEDDWGDSSSDHGKPPVADKSLFQRVDSRVNLASRRSMFTTVLHEPEHAAALANAASRSSPAIRRTGRQFPVEDESLAQPQVTCYVCGAGITINRRRDWQ
jgi:hypothetical protein